MATVPDPAVIKAAIEKIAAGGIASVTIGGQTVQATSIDQLLKALEYAQSQEASQKPGLGIRTQKITPYYP